MSLMSHTALEGWCWLLEMERLCVKIHLMPVWMLCFVKNFQRSASSSLDKLLFEVFGCIVSLPLEYLYFSAEIVYDRKICRAIAPVISVLLSFCYFNFLWHSLHIVFVRACDVVEVIVIISARYNLLMSLASLVFKWQIYWTLLLRCGRTTTVIFWCSSCK
uniref:Uncharacterized protein n=1 Tax=Lotus japonicus TaxID=34305 RepID=I3SYR1_LOTJA|nr:unknown [Lotus japonicus]